MTTHVPESENTHVSSSPEGDEIGYEAAEIRGAADLFRDSYDDLIQVARRLRRRTRSSETLNTVALVHEAFLRLKPGGQFSSEQHFFSSVALAMRHCIVDHARKGGKSSRPEAVGEDINQYSDEDSDEFDLPVEDVMAVRQGLEYVAAQDPRLVKVVDCRYFVGLTLEETAIALGMNEKTVRRDWVKARALLRDYLATGQTTRIELGGD